VRSIGMLTDMSDQPRPLVWPAITARIRSANRYWVDLGLAAAVAVPVSMPFLSAAPGEATPLGGLLNAGTVMPLIWRRRAPATVGLIVAVFALLVSAYDRPGQMLQYGGLVALYTVADLGRRWQRLAFLAGIFVVLPPGALWKGNSAPEFAFGLSLPLCAFLLGSLARASRARTTALQERAEQLRREQAAQVARAAAQERARIARDMHDVLAHAVSLMVVQAEAGPVVARADPARVEQVFEAIAETGREATVQLQQVLGVLKEDRDAGWRSPQPTVAAIPGLVDRMSGERLRVDLRTDGRPRRLTADAEVAAYRIVQEALTNTVRHAAAGSATVRLAWNDDGLVVTVTDDGRGQGLASLAGHGLVGMRERAAACGGSAEIGPAPGGGFRVRAHLPYAQRQPPGAHAVAGVR
jgi:signal transduction histidine kinase